MESVDWRRLTVDEVAAQIQDGTGDLIDQANVEMARRLIVALGESKKAANLWSVVNLGVGLAIVALTAVLAFHL